MRKDVFLSVTLDVAAARLLAKLAEEQTEGNKSQLVRQLVRSEAERRGLREPKREVQHVQAA